MKKTITIQGKKYKVRYIYKREDGSRWYVLLNTFELQGEFGDEWPVGK